MIAIMESNNTTLDLQQFFPSDLQIQKIETTSDTVYIWMKSRTRSITCPKCNKECKTYHAVHKRKVQDLPVWGKRTILMLSIYEFECENPECSCVSTTENFNGFLNGYSRMTERLADLVTQLALETSCEGAARILNSMNIAISGDTVIRTLLKRYDNQTLPSCGSCVGVDDFSFKKRHKYGTIIVDEETHAPVAILEGRNENTLKAWLEQNKHVTTITRDRASAYARAIEEVLPDAMQIADRFHLHQNLLEAVNKILGREVPATTAIPHAKETTIPEKSEHQETPNSIDRKKNHCHCG